jgi:hypothetical protein
MSTAPRRLISPRIVTRLIFFTVLQLFTARC